MTITVSDTNAPIIKGPSEIAVSYTEHITIEALKQMFLVTDNYDTLGFADLAVISDEYTVHSDVPGVYVIEFSVSDTTGNVTTHQLTMTVIDDIDPIIYIDQYIVVVESGSTFGTEDMLKLLRLSNEISNLDYQVSTLKDEYTGNENVAGEYVYEVKLTDSEGEELIREFKISVTEKEASVDYKMPIIYTSIGLGLITGIVIFKKNK